MAAVPADGTQVTITMLRDAQGGGVVVVTCVPSAGTAATASASVLYPTLPMAKQASAAGAMMKFPFSSSTAAEPAGTYALTSELKVPPVILAAPTALSVFSTTTAVPSRVPPVNVPPFIKTIELFPAPLSGTVTLRLTAEREKALSS